MTDRESSPAFAVLSKSAKRLLAVIETEMGDGSSVSISYAAFSMDHHLARRALSPALKQLDALGMIDISPGPRLVNVFRLSRRWCAIDADEAERLSALARELKPHRTFERREPKPVPKPKPVTVERPRFSQRRMPSLPTMPWQDDGR